MTRLEIYDQKESLRDDIIELKMQLAYAEEYGLSEQVKDEIVLRITVLYARFDGLVLLECLLRAGTHVLLEGYYQSPLARHEPGIRTLRVHRVPGLIDDCRNERSVRREAKAEYVVA
jgi:hypothetical protein